MCELFLLYFQKSKNHSFAHCLVPSRYLSIGVTSLKTHCLKTRCLKTHRKQTHVVSSVNPHRLKHPKINFYRHVAEPHSESLMFVPPHPLVNFPAQCPALN